MNLHSKVISLRYALEPHRVTKSGFCHPEVSHHILCITTFFVKSKVEKEETAGSRI